MRTKTSCRWSTREGVKLLVKLLTKAAWVLGAAGRHRDAHQAVGGRARPDHLHLQRGRLRQGRARTPADDNGSKGPARGRPKAGPLAPRMPRCRSMARALCALCDCQLQGYVNFCFCVRQVRSLASRCLRVRFYRPKPFQVAPPPHAMAPTPINGSKACGAGADGNRVSANNRLKGPPHTRTRALTRTPGGGEGQVLPRLRYICQQASVPMGLPPEALAAAARS